jgi:hypothetical protein
MHNARPNWAEVSLGALRRNYRSLRKLVGSEVEICAVVKADAYGHGIHFQVHGHLPALSLRGEAIQMPGFPHCRHKLVMNDFRLVALPKAGHEQNAPTDSRVPLSNFDFLSPLRC